MAESDNTEPPTAGCSVDGGWSSWGSWSDWYQTAKEKSAQALEFMKKDLTEFSNVMQQESSKAVSKTSETLKETLKTENTAAATGKIKHGISNFLDGITKALVIEAEDINEPTIKPRQDPSAIFDRAKARLHAIQVDPGTYYNEPSGTQKNFQEWQKNFDMEKQKGDISELLVAKVEVRALYTRLVPAEVSHADFWQRYFYKVHQLQLDEARKLALMQRAEMAGKKEDSISWDEEWSSDEDDVKSEKLKRRVTSEESSTEKQNETSEKESATQSSEDSLKTESVSETQNINAQITDKNKPVDKSESADIIEMEHVELSEQKNLDTKGQDENSESVVVKTDNSQECAKTESTEHVNESVKKDISESEQIMDESKKKNNSVDTVASTLSEEATQKKDISSSIQKSETSLKQDQLHSTNVTDSKTETASQEVKDSTSKDVNLKMKEKDGVVVVNPDRGSPSSESSSGNKDVVSLDDDWEQDFDVDLTEEDLKAADEIAKKLNLSAADYTKIAAEVEGDDDWESWQ